MIGADLTREHAAAVAALTDAQRDDLILTGIDPIDIALGMVGAARGRVVGDRFEPLPGDRWAYCTPIRVDPFHPLSLETPAPASVLRVGEIIDLVFWRPQQPRRWALRVGAAEYLGLIPPQYCRPERVAIHHGVIDWFRGGCNGLVILSPHPWVTYRVLSQCSSGLVAEDERHAEELRAALDHPWPRPEIFVRRETRHVL